MLDDFRKLFNCCGAQSHNDKEEDPIEIEKRRKIQLLKISNFKNQSETNESETMKMQTSNIEPPVQESDIYQIQISQNVQPIEDDLDKCLIDDKLVTEMERSLSNLKFSKRGIINYFGYMDNLEGFELLYQKENLLMRYKKTGSVFCDSIYLGFTKYKIPKQFLRTNENGSSKVLPTLKQIRDIV
jgi:hypothetical protein